MRIRTILIALLLSMSLSAQTTDRDLLRAYQREDMTVWRTYLDTRSNEALTGPITNDQLPITNDQLLYEYGYCGYIVAEAKKDGAAAGLMTEAKRRVARFREHVEAQRNQLPRGHYEMYLSAVYVYELRLKESIHPIKSMNLAKEATRLAPDDPLVLSYYGTCLFYAPQPFGSKKEALEYFQRADRLFQAPEWKDCWVREATKMYILQCREKLKKH